MSTAPKKIIAVTTATGDQGGSVVRALLADGTFAVRALTRKVDGDSAKALKALGAEVVYGDADDEDSLNKAFAGVYGVFANTDFWTIYFAEGFNQAVSQAREEKQGRALVDAAVSQGVKHFLWSTIGHSEKTHCYHCESKYNVDQYLQTKSLARTSLYTSFYYENLSKVGLLKKDEKSEDFVLTIPVPVGTKIPAYAAADTGAWALAALKAPETWTNKDMDLVGEYLTPAQFGAILSRVSGKKITVTEFDTATFESQAFREMITDEMWLNMKLFVDGDFNRDVKASHAVNPKASTFEAFSKQYAGLKTLVGY